MIRIGRGDIAKRLNRALGKRLLPAVLTRVTQGSYTAGNLTGGANVTTTTHKARGFVDEWPGDFPTNQTFARTTEVARTDKMVTLLGASIKPETEPQTGDRVVIDGKTYRVIGVGTDPDKATYKLQVRGG